MRLLVTSSRMPFALDEIRKFARCGHRVVAADALGMAPGSHSRLVEAAVRLAPPEFEPERFLAEVKEVVLARRIDLVVPCFEEVFYLARHLAELSEVVCVLASDFDVLARLHHKARFNTLAREVGIRVPDTTMVTSRRELIAALPPGRRYFARPAWSRGGLEALTNAGPLAGARSVDDCDPTPDQPWIVQDYVDGTDVCTFSVARHGRLSAHCSYVHPRQIEHAGGIVFESIVDPDTLAAATRIVEATGYHGQISLDFRRGQDGLVALECNPRPTAGVHLMGDEMLCDAVLEPPNGHVRIVPAGVRRMYLSAVVRNLVLNWNRAREDLTWLLSVTRDVYAELDDALPALYQVLSYGHVLDWRRRHRHRSERRHTSLVAAYFEGIQWNGGPIP